MAASEAIFRLLVEAVQDYAIFALDAQGEIITWNLGSERLTGYTAKEAVGKNVSLLFTEEDRARGHSKRELETAAREGRVEDEGWRQRKDGRRFWASTIVTRLLDEKGRLVGFAKVTRDLSERRAIEELTRWKHVFKHASWGMVLSDPENRVIEANDAFARMHGTAAEHWVGRPVEEMFAPEWRGRVRELIQQVNEDGHLVYESQHLRKDGSTFSVLTEASAFKDAAGRVLFRASNMQDITERRRTEVAAQRGRAQLEATFQAMHDGVVVFDMSGKVVMANEAEARIVGYPDVQALMQDLDHFAKVFELREPDGRLIPVDQWPVSRVLRGESIPRWDVRGRRLDTGQEWFFSYSGAPVRDEKGRQVLALTITRDITEQWRALEGQRFLADATAVLSSSLEVEATLQRLADLVNAHIADWCSIDLAVDGAQPRKVALSHPIAWKSELIRELQRKYPTNWQAQVGAANVLRTGKSELYTDVPDSALENLAVDAEHLAILRGLGIKSGMVVPIRARDRILGAITLVSSVSGRRYRERDLEMAEELARRAGIAIENAHHLQQAQRAILVRDEFLSIASHELKTPLTSLKLQAQMRKRALELGDTSWLTPDRMLRFVNDCERQINRLARLVDDMLDISRLATGRLPLRLERFDLSGIIREIVERFLPQLHVAGITIVLEAGEPVVGDWDRNRIEQIFVNLMTNAMKFGGGRPILVRVERRGSHAVLTVHDEGIGIAKKDQVRIFQQFERAVSATEISGLGLGLFIVKQLLESLGGSVSVESELGKGATFVVELPLNSARETSIAS